MTCNAVHQCVAHATHTANHASFAVVLVAAVGLPILVVLLFAAGAILSAKETHETP